jgi:hypothetical protein
MVIAKMELQENLRFVSFNFIKGAQFQPISENLIAQICSVGIHVTN